MTRANAASRDSRPTILFVYQIYLPDRGQYWADVAEELAGRGYRVVVLTADRGYDDPSVRYPRREILGGVEVVRLPFSSFGKGSLRARVFGAGMFLAQAFLRGLFLKRLRGIVIGTSPPMASVVAVLIAALRGVPVNFWIMDVNPDQAVALGMVPPSSLPVRALDFANRIVLRRARNVIVPDRFMAERVNRKRNVADKLSVIPLWSHDRLIEPTDRIENPFRSAHNLGSKFVVMHAGNHGPSNPIETLVDAALLLRDDPRFAFVFVGGGIRKSQVEAVAGDSILSLPYEPLERIKYSLSAADVQVVTQGDNMVGIVHPSKFYAAMAVARPVVFIGPAVSHAGEVIAQHEIGWRIGHGDAAGFAALLRRCVGDGASLMPATGARARAVVQEYFSERAKCGELCDLISAALNSEPTRRGATSG